MAADAFSDQDADLESRVQRALKVLTAIGGAAEVEKYDDKIVIRGGGCPLAAAVTVHPEVCQVAETLIGEIVKAPVEEHCDRDGTPLRRFEIQTAPTKTARVSP